MNGQTVQGITYAQFIAFSAAYSTFNGTLNGFIPLIGQYFAIQPQLENLKPILEEEPEAYTEKTEAGPLSGAIEFREVKFSYENGVEVLHGISFKVRAGENVAIVGKSGSGKSTLVRLLLGFEKAQKGSIFYDSYEMGEVNLPSIRRQLGVVLQNGQLMTGDIFTNIVGTSNLTQDDAWRAAQMAGIADDISMMPMGMQTVISKQQIAWRVAQAFYQVLQYKDIINVREEEINNLNTHLQTVQIQYEVGTVALADVLSTNVQIANSKQALNSARANFQNAVANLNNIIGLPVDTPLNIDEDFDFVPFDKSEAECIEFALNNRPDAKAAALNVKSYQENISQAKAGYRPRVNLYVQKYFSGETLFKDNHNADRWSAGLQMSWNIFDNNVTAAQVQQAKAQLKKSESAASQILDEVKLDVHNAYTNLAVARLNISITQDAVKQAQEQYLIAQVRYEEGVDTNLIVMDAQEKLTQAKTNFFTALYSYNTSRAQLFKAMGIFEIERGAGVPNPQ